MTTDKTQTKRKDKGSKYVEMHECSVNDKNGITKYLVDKDGNVFTYNLNAPKRIGQRLIDGTIKITKDSE